jgi:hypothetical protein
VNRIDVEAVVLRVLRTDPVATIVAPWLVHHPRYSVNAEREAIVRPELSPDRGDSVNGTKDAPDRAHGDESIPDLKGMEEAIAPSNGVGFQAIGAKSKLGAKRGSESCWRLTVKLRGRTEAPNWSRGCTLPSCTRGDTSDVHGPLQRLLGGPPCELDGLRTLAQKNVSSKFARDVVSTFIAQSSHIDVLQ